MPISTLMGLLVVDGVQKLKTKVASVSSLVLPHKCTQLLIGARTYKCMQIFKHDTLRVGRQPIQNAPVLCI